VGGETLHAVDTHIHTCTYTQVYCNMTAKAGLYNIKLRN